MPRFGTVGRIENPNAMGSASDVCHVKHGPSITVSGLKLFSEALSADPASLTPRGAPTVRESFSPFQESTMASLKRWLPMALVAVLSAGCYHQVVQTGRSPGNTVVDKPWVATWVFGLVQAQPIETRPLCPSGIATVETEMSFLNGLVGGVTLGIFTPQHVRITCATSTSALPRDVQKLTIPADASVDEERAIVARAIHESAALNAPVVLYFSH